METQHTRHGRAPIVATRLARLWSRELWTLTLALVALLAVELSGVLMSQSASRLALLIGCGAALFWGRPAHGGRPRAGGVVASLVAVVAWLTVREPAARTSVAALLLALTCHRLLAGSTLRRAVSWTVASAGLFVVVVRLTGSLAPGLRVPITELADTAALAVLADGSGDWVIPGPSILGGNALVLFTGALFGRFVVVERRLARCTVSIAGLVLLMGGLAMAALALPAGWFARPWQPVIALAIGVLAAIPVAALALVPALPEPETRRTGPVRSQLRVPVALVGATVAVLAVLLEADRRVPDTEPRVTFYSAHEGAILNWDRPTFGAYGGYSSGMFGLLPEYLRDAGYSTDIIRERITARHLQDTDCLAVINVNTEWTEDELVAIWRWVSDGGSLLVIGDHTGVQGTRDSSNTLLSPFGIRFNYDSALGLEGIGFFGSVSARGPWPAATPASGLGISVGASLDLDSGRAWPVVVSDFGLEDLGNAAAGERAFLGDYTLSPRERVGDMVLVAAAEYGRGRALVFGDTSTFQNPNAVYHQDTVVGPCFEWLTGNPSLRLGWLQTVLALVFAAAWLLTQAAASTRWPVAVATTCAVLGLWSAYERQPRIPTPPPAAPTAFIDVSHGSPIDIDPRAENDISGLVVNLERNRIRPRVMAELDPGRLGDRDVLVTIAPVRAYTEAELDSLDAFMQRGGLVLAAAGRRHAAGLDALLARHGIRVGPHAIGSIPLRRSPGRVHLFQEYVEAWRVEPVGQRFAGDVEVLGTYHGNPIAVRVSHGAGSLVLVADTYHFSSQNLEGMEDVLLPNIEFLRRVLEQHLEGQS
ncbi:MAG: hypothetical protein IPM29_24810 [Planctomycetes bacterium]|nr:hypothetical protein [Planctomycetota bacterium]